MRDLQQRIKAKERAIEKNTAKIQRQKQLLKPYFHTKTASTLGILGSFVSGFVISRKKSWLELAMFMTSSSMMLVKISNYLKLFGIKTPHK